MVNGPASLLGLAGLSQQEERGCSSRFDRPATEVGAEMTLRVIVVIEFNRPAPSLAVQQALAILLGEGHLRAPDLHDASPLEIPNGFNAETARGSGGQKCQDRRRQDAESGSQAGEEGRAFAAVFEARFSHSVGPSIRGRPLL